MDRRFIGSIVLSVLLISGCSSSNNGDYKVLFSEPVMIFDKVVYNNGEPVGKVTKVEISPSNRSILTVNLESKFKSLLGQNHVFIINSGQLCLTTIAPFGAPLDTDAKLSGFASKAELAIFRLKHLFADKVAAAHARAKKLAQW